jgi:hypothetical protein
VGARVAEIASESPFGDLKLRPMAPRFRDVGSAGWYQPKVLGWNTGTWILHNDNIGPKLIICQESEYLKHISEGLLKRPAELSAQRHLLLGSRRASFRSFWVITSPIARYVAGSTSHPFTLPDYLGSENSTGEYKVRFGKQQLL